VTALLSVYTDKGKCVGVCNANCYNAKPPSELHPHTRGKAFCKCICAGRNHAAGLNRALNNTLAGIGLKCEYVQEFAKAHDLDPSRLMVIDRARVKSRKARKAALARLCPQPPGPLFELAGDRREPTEGQPAEGARQRRE
jgi:hypothetical protein